MMHYHGEFNLITPENVKNVKIINDYIIHYRGHNCTLLTSHEVFGTTTDAMGEVWSSKSR